MSNYLYYHQHSKHKFERIKPEKKKVNLTLPAADVYNQSVNHKLYQRFPYTKFSAPVLSDASFVSLLKRRQTTIHANFKKEGQPYSESELSCLLAHSAANKNILFGDEYAISRLYPSGGAKYPLELYLCVLREGQGLEKGVYHYAPTTHSYARLWDLPEEFTFDHLVLHTVVENDMPQIVVLFTAQFYKTVEKYGDRGYRHIFLEAGHVGQNMCLIGGGMERRIVPYGGVCDEYAEPVLLDIDGVSESIVHAVCLY